MLNESERGFAAAGRSIFHRSSGTHVQVVLLMLAILHYLKDPKLWELWYIPSYGYVVQGLYHQPYQGRHAQQEHA